MTKRVWMLAAACGGLLTTASLWAQVGPGGVVGGRGGVVGGTTTTRPGITLGSTTRSGTPTTPTVTPVDPTPAVPIVLAKTFPAVAPDPIERTEFNAKVKPISKNLTSAMAMMVIDGPDGELGLTADVIATVTRSGPAFSAGILKKQAAVGPEMLTSFDEAVRAVQMRYPKLEPARIDFSFGDKYTPHEGGSAGTCFAVMLLSEIEGFEIDSKVAVTGDITVDWKVRKIGGLGAKVRGAVADKCLYTGVPDENRDQICDMVLFYGDVTLRDIQVFSLGTLQDAVGLLRKDRSPQMVEAMKEFADLKPKLASGRGSYSLPANVKVLENIVSLAPNHESAKMMLQMAKGTFPRVLTPLYAIDALFTPFEVYAMVAHGKVPLNRQTITPAQTAEARKHLAHMGPICPPELQPLVTDMRGIVDVCDSIAAGQARPDLLEGKWNNFVTHLDVLKNNKDFREKLMRSGM